MLCESYAHTHTHDALHAMHLLEACTHLPWGGVRGGPWRGAWRRRRGHLPPRCARGPVRPRSQGSCLGRGGKMWTSGLAPSWCWWPTGAHTRRQDVELGLAILPRPRVRARADGSAARSTRLGPGARPPALVPLVIPPPLLVPPAVPSTIPLPPPVSPAVPVPSSTTSISIITSTAIIPVPGVA